MPCQAHAVPLPCLAAFNSHMPCRPHSILRQCRVRVSPSGSRKYANCLPYSLTDLCASGNNLRGSPRVAGRRSPTCRLWTADSNSHMPCHVQAASMPRYAVALRSRFQNGVVVAWHGRGMACMNTAALCKSNGRDTI
jgi:hypothetical protein